MEFDPPLIVSLLRYNAALGAFVPLIYILKLPKGYPVPFEMIIGAVIGALAWGFFFYALAEIIHWLAKIAYHHERTELLTDGKKLPEPTPEPLEF